MYDLEITCSKCGTRYGLRKISIPVRYKDSINCLSCGNEDIYKWNEANMWIAEIVNDIKLTR